MACCDSTRVPYKLKIGYLPTEARVRGCSPLRQIRGFTFFLAFFFFAVVGAAAQDSPGSFSLAMPTGSGTRGPIFAGYAPKTWQISAGFQFDRVAIRGAFPSFNTFGVNASAV